MTSLEVFKCNVDKWIDLQFYAVSKGNPLAPRKQDFNIRAVLVDLCNHAFFDQIAAEMCRVMEFITGLESTALNRDMKETRLACRKVAKCVDRLMRFNFALNQS